MAERLIRPQEMTEEQLCYAVFEHYMTQVDDGLMTRETAFEIIAHEISEIEGYDKPA